MSICQYLDQFYKIAVDSIKPAVYEFQDGFVINGDSLSEEVIEEIKKILSNVPTKKCSLITTDPPYGKIVSDEWDNPNLSQEEFASWLIKILNTYDPLLNNGAAFYMWGGIGIPEYRPFLEFLSRLENESNFEVANLITWAKKRAYGTSNNYLFTREECAYLVKGDAKHPKKFKIPLLDTLRGYEGFNKKYPAKSPYLRRTNVWTDINELFSGKIHPTEKPPVLYEKMIEVHTKPGEYVIDMFAGSGACGVACKNLNRKFILVEKDKEYVRKIVERLS